MTNEAAFEHELHQSSEIGFVEEIRGDVIRISGIPQVKFGEIVLFGKGARGYIYNVHEFYAEAILLSNLKVSINEEVTRGGSPISIPAHAEMSGHTFDSLGVCLDEPALNLKEDVTKRTVFIHPPGLPTRLPLTESFETGISVVDITTPLSLGQRELILGDRKTGKTEFLLHFISELTAKNLIFIYCAIGKRDIEIQEITDRLKSSPVAKNIIVVASSSRDGVGKIYVTPYTAMTIAEHFRDLGKNVVLILDDLSTHAQFYRELALSARRFPGRGSYPGDMFYVHAQLLERAGNFKLADGKAASITCLPVAQSVLGDITGYITTNLMSITDGHIYLDSEIFDEGRRPALNPFLSVTRVGHQTQSDLLRDVSREVTSFLIVYRRSQNYSHFGSEVSEEVKSALAKGKLVYALFDQMNTVIIPAAISVYMLAHIWAGSFKGDTVESFRGKLKICLETFKTNHGFASAITDLMTKSHSFRDFHNGVHSIAFPS